MPKNRPQAIHDLNKRSLFLFKSLVEHFIQDGHPVGSRTLSRDTDLALSPATIRNVMADLEDMGLLRSPHTSAGRVPTARGLRLFVDSLLRIEQLEERQVRHMAQEIAAQDDVQHLITRASGLLSDITNLAAVVTLPRRRINSLEHIEFVTLSDNRILVILVLSNKEIQNRIIHTAKTYTQSQLQRTANYLNSTFRGKDLETIRTEVLSELRKLKEDVNELMQAAIEMAQKAFVSTSAEDDVVISGQTNLMGVAELSDLDKLKRLFESFNQKRDILHLLENAINAKGIQIFIGEESGYEVLDDCSIIASPYQGEGRILGVLGVIGPTRMDYERVIPVVDMTARILGSALNFAE